MILIRVDNFDYKPGGREEEFILYIKKSWELGGEGSPYRKLGTLCCSNTGVG